MKNIKKLAIALTVASITLPAAANAAKPARPVCVNIAVANIVVSKNTNNVSISYGFTLKNRKYAKSFPASEYNMTTSYIGSSRYAERVASATAKAKADISNNPVKVLPLCDLKKDGVQLWTIIYLNGLKHR